MTTIIILETGEGREVNPLGKKPRERRRWKEIIPNHFRHEETLSSKREREDWQAAESKLRTLPVRSCTMSCHFSCDMPCEKPRTLWRARLSDDQTAWVIVERVEGK